MARCDLKAVSVRFMLRHLHQQDYIAPTTMIQVVAILAAKPRFGLIAGEQAVKTRLLIEREDEVTTRSELFAKLARAILPVSEWDAGEYFRAGLEQLDAIGSGDYEFTGELLEFASTIRGRELSQIDFHTLTNVVNSICPTMRKSFRGGSFATAMSKTSGPRGLAKLSRWHDRGKIDLEYTLLPYLIALLRDEKITPEDALALNYLACSVELSSCNTRTFATTMHERHFPKLDRLSRN